MAETLRLAIAAGNGFAPARVAPCGSRGLTDRSEGLGGRRRLASLPIPEDGRG